MKNCACIFNLTNFLFKDGKIVTVVTNKEKKQPGRHFGVQPHDLPDVEIIAISKHLSQLFFL